MYLNFLLISIVEKIAILTIEVIFNADLIIDEIKTLVFNEKTLLTNSQKLSHDENSMKKTR